MPSITMALFAAESAVDTSDWKKLSVPGLGPRQVGEFLEGFGWDGSAAASVGLKMAADNLSVAAARLSVVGTWSTAPTLLQAQKLWSRAPANIWLEVDLRDMGAFRFGDGEMVSKYIPDIAIKHKFIIQGEDDQKKELSDEEVSAAGITPFTVRAACGLSSACSAKNGIWLNCIVLVYPATEEELKELSAASKSPAWPGMKLAEGDIPMLPQAGRGKPALNGKEWGCPVTPAVVPGAPWDATGKDFQQGAATAAIGCLLNQGLFPSCPASADSLRQKWEAAQRAPDKLGGKKPETTWPAHMPSTAPAKRGKNI